MSVKHERGVWSPPPPTTTTGETRHASAAAAMAPSSAFLQHFRNRALLVGKDGAHADLVAVTAKASQGAASSGSSNNKESSSSTTAADKTGVVTNVVVAGGAAGAHGRCVPRPRRIVAPDVLQARARRSLAAAAAAAAAATTQTATVSAHDACDGTLHTMYSSRDDVDEADASPSIVDCITLDEDANDDDDVAEVYDDNDDDEEDDGEEEEVATGVTFYATGVALPPPLPSTTAAQHAPSRDAVHTRATATPQRGSDATRQEQRQQHAQRRLSATHATRTQMTTHADARRASAHARDARDGVTPQTTAPSTPQYTPHSLDEYKALMERLAQQRRGGLGPSDTDEQRRARAKKERERAYGVQAERAALERIAKQKQQQQQQEQQQQGEATVAANVEAHGNTCHSSSSSGGGDGNKAVTTATTTTATTTVAPQPVPREVQQARERRTRALAYARQLPVRVTRRASSSSSNNKGGGGGGADDARDTGGASGITALRDADVLAAERRALQLADLEAAHAQKKSAADAIRRQVDNDVTGVVGASDAVATAADDAGGGHRGASVHMDSNSSSHHTLHASSNKDDGSVAPVGAVTLPRAVVPIRGITDVLRSRINTLGELILLLTARALDEADKLAGADGSGVAHSDNSSNDKAKACSSVVTTTTTTATTTMSRTSRRTSASPTMSTTAHTVVRVTRSVRKAAPLSLAQLQTAHHVDTRAQSCPLGGGNGGSAALKHNAASNTAAHTATASDTSHRDAQPSPLAVACTPPVACSSYCNDEHTTALLAQSAAWFAAFLQRHATGNNNNNSKEHVTDCEAHSCRSNSGRRGSGACTTSVPCSSCSNASSRATRTRAASSDVIVVSPSSSGAHAATAHGRASVHECAWHDGSNDHGVVVAHDGAAATAALPLQRVLSADEVQYDVRAASLRAVCHIVYDAHGWRHDMPCRVTYTSSA